MKENEGTIFLIKEFQKMNVSTLKNRIEISNIIVENPTIYFKPLLKILVDYKDKNGIKAAWVLEKVCETHLSLLFSELPFFIQNLKKIKSDSALRSLAKICVFLGEFYFLNPVHPIKKKLTTTFIDVIIETAFDWLITEHKVAVKVYAMETLFQFGKDRDWVHEELKLILPNEITLQSPAYRARAKRILKKLN